MRKRPLVNIAASARQRLLNQARQTGRPFAELLQHFAMERFLYRLHKSPHGAEFVLKGALALTAWRLSVPTRPTMDIDLLGRTDSSAEAIGAITRDICLQPVEPDGMVFDADSIEPAPTAPSICAASPRS